MAARVVVMAMVFLCMVVATSSDWVDYSSSFMCCSNTPVDVCDPKNPVTNSACKDVCHYGGCRKGGQCEETAMGFSRVCHCNC